MIDIIIHLHFKDKDTVKRLVYKSEKWTRESAIESVAMMIREKGFFSNGINEESGISLEFYVESRMRFDGKNWHVEISDFENWRPHDPDFFFGLGDCTSFLVIKSQS